MELSRVVHCCVICGQKHSSSNCNLIQITQYVPDNEIPSKAKLTLPSFLKLETFSDGSCTIVTKSDIKCGTQFGPLLAEKSDTFELTTKFPLKIFTADEKTDYFLDMINEERCNWMMFIAPADHLEDQNMICYQEEEKIFYLSTKKIFPGDPLKVWYSPFYALKMQKDLLTLQAKKPVAVEAVTMDINALIKTQQNIVERKVWTCKFCGQIEKNIVPFAKHVLKHYTAQLKKMCETCSKTFASLKRLKNHIKIVHGPSVAQPMQAKPQFVETSNVSKSCKDVALGGPLLNDLFADSSDLQQTDFYNFEMNLDNQLLDNDNLMVENFLNENVKDLDHFNFEIDDSQKNYVCDICLKQFSKVRLLITHLKHHTGDFVCVKCNKVFCRQENLKSHLCNTDVRHRCNLCDKFFTLKKYLSRHFAAVHAKKFECSNCQKTYHSNKDLLEHNCCNIPIADKQVFKCPICDKEFFAKRYLQKHIKVHRSRAKLSTNAGSVICEICGLYLETRNSYHIHKKKHQEPAFSCQVCDKKFCRRDGLKAHTLSHGGDSEFECTICNKKLKTSKILALHMKNHSSQDYFKCSTCGACFKQSWSLSNHVQNSHEGKKITCPLPEYYRCPICEKPFKLKSSLFRHCRKSHLQDVKKTDLTNIQPKLLCLQKSVNKKKIAKPKNVAKENQQMANSRSDDLDNDLFAHIDKFLNSSAIAEDKSQSRKEAVDDVVKELEADSSKPRKQADEVCLSIPDLLEDDQEIILDKDAYILDNGTIVQPQADLGSVVIYMLDQPYQQ